MSNKLYTEEFKIEAIRQIGDRYAHYTQRGAEEVIAAIAESRRKWPEIKRKVFSSSG